MKVKPSPRVLKDGEQQLTNSKAYKYLMGVVRSGLYPNSCLVLLYIYYHSGCRYGDISKHYGWTNVYMFKVIRQLSASGHVSLEFNPNKTSYVTLLDEGLKVCKSLLSIK